MKFSSGFPARFIGGRRLSIRLPFPIPSKYFMVLSYISNQYTLDRTWINDMVHFIPPAIQTHSHSGDPLVLHLLQHRSRSSHYGRKSTDEKDGSFGRTVETSCHGGSGAEEESKGGSEVERTREIYQRDESRKQTWNWRNGRCGGGG